MVFILCMSRKQNVLVGITKRLVIPLHHYSRNPLAVIKQTGTHTIPIRRYVDQSHTRAECNFSTYKNAKLTGATNVNEYINIYFASNALYNNRHLTMSKKKNLDVYLAEVFKQFIAIKDDDFKRAQEVFKGVFEQVKAKMGEQCNYFSKYSNQVLYAGSVYDGIKVSKMDEFDMDIVIRLPINYEDGPNGIVIENDQPGFVKLKIANAFDNLDKQNDWEKCHKVTREWRDADKYFLQNKFRQWLHGIVQKALNELRGQVDVNGTTYLVTYKEAGPAYTLNVRNAPSDEHYLLDVDLVPVIRFLHPRWPEGYKEVEGSQVRDWLVVPKPHKGIKEGAHKNRCWRLSFQDYEREMMKGCQQLKMTIRLMKKLRDGLELRCIASYYIKTLFLWELENNKDKTYWCNKISVCFRSMVQALHAALVDRSIRYFWHPDNNLIEAVKPTVLKVYADRVKEVLDAIIANDVDKVVEKILTVDELRLFKESDVYQSHQRLSGISKQLSIAESSCSSLELRALSDEIDSARNDSARNDSTNDKWADLDNRVRDLEDRMREYERRLKILEEREREALLKLEAGEREVLVKLEKGNSDTLVNHNGVKSIPDPDVFESEPLLLL